MPRGLDLSAIDQAVNANKMQKMQRDTMLSNLLRQRKADERQAGIEGAYAGAFDPSSGEFDEGRLVKGIGQVSPMEAYNQKNILAKQRNDSQTSDIDLKMKKAKYGRDVLATVTPETYGSTIQQLKSQGFAFAENAPPEYSPEWVQKNVMDADAFVKSVGGGSANPYFTPLDTEQGLMSYNNRTGTYEPLQANGQPLMRSTASPTLQGRIAGAKASATGDYKINTDLDGTVTTDTKLANQINGGQPSFQIPPAVQQQRDMGRTQILQSELAQEQANLQQAQTPQERETAQRNIGLLHNELGIKVPTKAEEAAAVEQAKLGAKNTTEAQTELPSILSKAEKSIKYIDEMIGSEDGKIKPHPGFESYVGATLLPFASKIHGTDEASFKQRELQLTGSAFLEAFESLKGGGHITEIEGEKATQAIQRMNNAVSEDEYIKAGREFQSVLRDGMKRAKTKAGVDISQPSNNGWTVKKVN